jgi:uncharacterized integral membrane protein
MYRNILITTSYVVIIITLIVLSILIAKETDRDSQKYKRMETSRYVLLSILGVYTIGILIYFTVIHSKEKILAKRVKRIMSSPKSKENDAKFDKLCDKLFRKRPALYDQFSHMKKTRSKQEVRTLCGNHAKNILGMKV